MREPDGPTHSLVIGGTGMLRGVCLELARRGAVVTVLGRSHRRLASLVREAEGLGAGRVHALAADYQDLDAVAMGVRSASMARGPLGLVVAWVHGTAPGVVPMVAEMLAARGARPAPVLVDVVGSAGADASGVSDVERELAGLAGLEYRRVVLGFVMEAGGSRWLTDGEICAGVIRAIDEEGPRQVVGVVEPWEGRPR